MMAITRSIPSQSLTVEADDDQMEVGTSPYIQHDDIDLDLDDQNEQFVEDNSMVDDHTDNLDSMQADDGESYHDDIMYDGEEGENVDLYDDLDMNADVQEYSHPDQHSPAQDLTSDKSISQDRPPDIVHHEAGTEQPPQQPQISSIFEEENTNPDEPISEFLDNQTDDEPTAYVESAPNISGSVAEAKLDHSEEPPQEDQPLEASNTGVYDISQTEQNTDHESPEDTVNHDENNASTTEDIGTVQDAAIEPSALTLHPVVIEYDAALHYLFPCRDADVNQCTLKDVGLASRKINEMLTQLRLTLQASMGTPDETGFDPDVTDELVLDIPALGLHICEDSTYAAELTFAQIIDTYMMLAQNEQLSDIKPLHCLVSYRTCLRTQMKYLVDEARQGKTLTSIIEENDLLRHGTSYNEAHELIAEETHPETTQYFDTEDQLQETFDDDTREDATEAVTKVEAVHGTTVPDVDNEVDDEEYNEEYNENVAPVASSIPANEEDPEDDDPDDGHDLVDPTTIDQPTEVIATGEPLLELDETAENDEYDVKNVESTDDQNEEPNISEAQDHLPKVADADDETHHVVEQEEDLFADDYEEEDLEEDPIQNTNGHHVEEMSSAGNSHTQTPSEHDDLNFDEWDEEDQTDTTKAGITPVTPSKAANGKRKLTEEDDLLDLEFTPEPKRTRSS